MNDISAPVPTDPQALAEASATAMWSRDHATQGLGMAIERIAPGECRMSMTVRQDMLNGHQMCHGGFMFLLADSAFAFACNSYNQNAVASARACGSVGTGAGVSFMIGLPRYRQSGRAASPERR